VAAVAAVAAVETPATGDAARKRRRRRGGKRIEGAAPEAASAAAKPQPSAQVVATRVSQSSSNAGKTPSLLSRIKRRLESIVTRGPRSQH
jgi:ATP-dependent RNA helicase RhlB